MPAATGSAGAISNRIVISSGGWSELMHLDLRNERHNIHFCRAMSIFNLE
jgi:hypothetical protein